MKQTKTLRIIILPTISETQFFKDKLGKFQYISKEEKVYLGVKSSYQHLYFVSDSEIKEGDWIIDFMITRNEIKQYQGYNREGNAKKIEATTDNSLTSDYFPEEIKYVGIPPKKSKVQFPNYNKLPQIPQSFIEEYVKSNGTIKEVEVEIFKDFCKCGYGENFKQITTNSNNEVIVFSKSTKMYSREEVLNFGSWYSGIELFKVEKQLDKWDRR